MSEQARGPQLVGRDGVWVPDPFDRHRAALGEYAERIDDLARVYGEQLVRHPDSGPESERSAPPSPLEHLDPERAALTRRLDRELVAAQEALYLTQEEGCIFGVDANHGPFPVDMELVREIAAENSVKLDLVQERIASDPAADYLHIWVAEHEEAAAKSVSIARERAIRQQEHVLGFDAVAPPNGDFARREPEIPPNATVIGRGDVAASLGRLRTARHEALERSGAPEAARRIERGYVSVPRAIESLHRLIDERHLAELDTLSEPLAGLLKHVPDEYLQRRLAQLGDPEKGLDRGGAREFLRLEVARTTIKPQIDDLWTRVKQSEALVFYTFDQEGATQIHTSDPRLEVEVQQLNRLFREDHRLSNERQRLKDEGRDPARWLDDRHRVARSLAFTDEVAIRREMSLRQEAERSVVDPPKHIVDLIGPRPEPAAPERGEWEAITRDAEYNRVATQADLRDGLEPQRWRLLPDQRDLDQRIDDLRQARSLPPLAHEAAIDKPGF